MNKILASITDWISEYKNTEVSLRASSESDPTNDKKKINLDLLREDWRRSLTEALRDEDVQSATNQERIDLRKARQEKIKYDKQEQRAANKVDQLRSEFMDQYQTPEQKIMSFFSSTPIIPWHILDMKIQNKGIYNHLTIYQNKFAKKFADVIDVAEKMKLLDERMSNIKLDMRPATTEPNVKDRSIVSGNDGWNDNDKWVPDITYARNQWYNCTAERETEIRNIIADLWTEFGLSESEAIQLFVLRMWLGKYGWQGSDGRFCNVGNYRRFAIGPVVNGEVPYLYVNDDDAWFNEDSSKYARPQLSN